MRVLQVGYYPITQVVSGGQRRVVAVQQALAACGIAFDFFAVYPNRPDKSEHDFPLSDGASLFVDQIRHDFEIRLSAAVEADAHLLQRVGARVRSQQLSHLWLEHPFLWPLMKPIAQELGLPVVYSAHNIEWRMRAELLAHKGIRDRYAVVNLKRWELDLARASALLVACSESDAHYFREIGARDVVVFPNGADPPLDEIDQLAVDELMTNFSMASDAIHLVYVSSKHEPNWIGLERLVVEPLLRVAAEGARVKVLLIGSIADFVTEAPRRAAYERVTIPVGNVSNAIRNAAFAVARAAVLPIVTGGGTNLKTAEALLSGLPVIATTFAMRGFERFTTRPSVTIADTPEAAERAFRLLATSPFDPSARGRPDDEIRASCAWSHLIARFSSELAVRGFIASPHA
jgi:glycosyltransferase involved in cell wall biosynthesis